MNQNTNLNDITASKLLNISNQCCKLYVKTILKLSNVEADLYFYNSLTESYPMKEIESKIDTTRQIVFKLRSIKDTLEHVIRSIYKYIDENDPECILPSHPHRLLNSNKLPNFSHLQNSTMKFIASSPDKKLNRMLEINIINTINTLNKID